MVVSITNDVGIMGFVSDTASHGPGSRDAAEQDRNPIKVSSKLADIYTQKRMRESWWAGFQGSVAERRFAFNFHNVYSETDQRKSEIGL